MLDLAFAIGHHLNGFFWAKIGTFLAIGLLSIPPTIRFIVWRGAGVAPSDEAAAAVRRYLHAEVALFALLPAFAAAMARGYGGSSEGNSRPGFQRRSKS